MEIGLSSAAFYGYLETEESAATLHTYPLDFAEIFLESFCEYNVAFAQTVLSALDGVPCRSIHAKGTQFEGDLFGSSTHQVKDSFAILEGVFKAGKVLGAKYYVFHGPPALRHPLPPLQISHLSERLPQICSLSESYGIRFLWENVSWCACVTPEDVKALRSAFPSLGFVLDIKQALRSNQDPFQLLDAMGEMLCHVHVLDQDEDGRLCLPGQGTFDFPRLAKALTGAGYTQGILLEPYSSQSRNFEAVCQSLRYLAEIFQ